jgi:DNA-binding transcriptional ArsR family regulator
MQAISVIDNPEAAAAALDPVRSRLLAELTEPASAAALAARMGIARQKLNYHLRELESHGLVKVASKRKWGGLTERLLVATASSYLVSPTAMGRAAVDPDRHADRLSASYLIALAARMVREVSTMIRKSEELDKRLPTLSIDAEIRFRSPTDRAAFTHELTEVFTKICARYHDAASPEGRSHRLVLVAHPLPQEKSETRKPS